MSAATVAGATVSPPDAAGRRWRSRVSAHLRATGKSDAAGVVAFCREAGVAFPAFARIEAGLEPPSAEYRRRAAELLGVEAFEVVE